MPLLAQSNYAARVATMRSPIKRDGLMLALYSGLRNEDTRTMRFDQVDLDDATVHLPNPKGGPGAAFAIPLSKMPHAILRARVDMADANMSQVKNLAEALDLSGIVLRGSDLGGAPQQRAAVGRRMYLNQAARRQSTATRASQPLHLTQPTREPGREPQAACSRTTPETRRWARSMANSRILTWNGTDLPEELCALPPGRYVIESADDVPHLTHDEDEGIHQALASMRAGNGQSVEQVRGTINLLRR